jgi:DNA polymerase-3 subunit delta'
MERTVELNRDIKNRFLSLLKNGKLSHSYIIAGGEGAGKLDFALYCAKAIFCDGEPCCKCESCRKIENESHPDVRIINKGETSSFKIDEVRRITDSINTPPNEEKKKIYILDHCENMTVQAQNALLKVFEEQPEYAVFFILTEKKEALLPTVRSRASFFTVSPLEKDELFSLLKSKFPKESDEDLSDAVRLSEGFFGRAVKLLEKSSKEERKISLELAKYILLEKSGYKTAKLLNGYKNKRESAIRLLMFVLYAVRDTFLYKKGRESLCLLSMEEAKAFSENSSERLVLISDEITEAVNALENNGNYTSCIGKLCGIII